MERRNGSTPATAATATASLLGLMVTMSIPLPAPWARPASLVPTETAIPAATAAPAPMTTPTPRPIAADNTLTEAERAAGWILLFDGTTLEGWTTPTGTPGRTPVDRVERAINPHGSGGYMMIHRRDWSDFVLAVDFKISPGCNSGVFVRTFPLEPRPGKDVGYNGLEVAIDDTTTAGYHDTGALYDLVRPSANRMTPAGTWNHLEITCDGPRIAVAVNGRVVTETDLDRWTAPNRRPDGSAHKFDVAYEDHPRHGYIGLQDHGAPCWFRNIKLRPLHPAPPGRP